MATSNKSLGINMLLITMGGVLIYAGWNRSSILDVALNRKVEKESLFSLDNPAGDYIVAGDVAGPSILEGGWAGTEGIIRRIIDPVAAQYGVSGSSYKRNTKYTSSGGISDHWIGNKRAYAADYPATAATGDKLARAFARALGIKNYSPASYKAYYITIGGQRFRAQILWRVKGHYDHVHVGVEAV